MKNYFIRFFGYNNWANATVMDYITAHQITDEGITLLASHMAHAQTNWYFRAIAAQNDVPLWAPLPFSSAAASLAENGILWLSHLTTLQDEDFHNKLAYKNMAGDPYCENLSDILTHLLNHSTHHRGQVVQKLRALGLTPPGTDFILFARQFPG